MNENKDTIKEMEIGRFEIRPRFSYYAKIMTGFGFIIIFLVVAGLFSLLQLLPKDEVEFKILPMIQYLDKIYHVEIDATNKYFSTNDEIDGRKLILTINEFQKVADSIFQFSRGTDVQQYVDTLLIINKNYLDLIEKQRQIIKNRGKFDSTNAFTMIIPVSNLLHKQIDRVRNAHLPILNNALINYNRRMSNAIDVGLVILLLAFSIGGVFAFLLARTFTKPIRALKSVTKKVGEGQYETIPVTTRDEIGELTHAFNLMSEKLRQLDDMRMQMMSEISHEMRTPLQVIKAGCYSIINAKEAVPLSQKQRDAVGMIHQATNRINNFVNSFLDIAKMEAGLMKFSREQMDIVQVLHPLIQEAQLIAQTRQINLEFIADAIPPMMIDKERMSQAISNLLSNALKYTPDNGKITISLKRVKDTIGDIKTSMDCLRIEVQDTGVGIPENDLGRLFNKFYQAKNTPLVKEKGSGLGLALVKHVAEAHGGKVSVQSRVGEGSTFSVVIPI